MFRRDRPVDTTDTVLERLQRSAPENIVVKVGENRYLIPANTVKMMAWGGIPDAIKDPDSPDAKKYSVQRTGLKALLRPFLPEILKQTWGVEVEIKPRLNILTWFCSYFIHYFINFIASGEWVVHVESCEGCGEGVFRVVGISPNASSFLPPRAIPGVAPTDREPLPGRGHEGSSGETDRNLVGGQMGNCGDDRIRQDDNGEGTTIKTEGVLPRGADLHSGHETGGGL